MRFLFIILFSCFSMQLIAQEHQLAYQYYRNGDYEKAAAIYQALHQKNPVNTNYTHYLIDCYQQLDTYDKVEFLIQKQLKNYPNQEYLYVELGYNHQLQHNNEAAEVYYKKST